MSAARDMRRLVRRGYSLRGFDGGALRVEQWGPEQTEPEKLREHCAFPDGQHLDDRSLQVVIDGAKEWIAGRRWSWTIVAANYLKDGRYHP